MTCNADFLQQAPVVVIVFLRVDIREMNAIGRTRAETLNDNFQFNYSAGVVVMHQCIPFGEGG